MTTISFHKALLERIPFIRLGCIQCQVRIVPGNQRLLDLEQKIISYIRSGLTLETISQKPTIKSTKEAYRKLGKDPSRYRPSAEALARRVVQGKNLYKINNAIDVLNLVSLESGFSIGGYDADKISGHIEFGVGKENEPYEAIGRGDLNIENLPVFRDVSGAFGSPTSDSLRTMVTDHTKRFLMIIVDFDHHENLKHTVRRSVELLEALGGAASIETHLYSAIM